MNSVRALLDKFEVSEETQELTLRIIREARARTGPGTGHDLRGNDPGLVAASVYLASQQLNNAEVKQAVAQKASCLKPKDFKHLLTTIERVLEQETFSYDDLHKAYKTLSIKERLEPYILRTEDELGQLPVKLTKGSKEFICTVYFWVVNIVNSRKISGTETFAAENSISVKRLSDALTALNTHCEDLEERIRASQKRPSSPAKPAPSPSIPVRFTPRKPNPAALRELPSKDTPKASRPTTGDVEMTDVTQTSPSRRSGRVIPFLPHTTPRRALPSKDSPKRKQPADDDDDDDDDVPMPETSSKQRRVATPMSNTPLPKPIFPPLATLPRTPQQLATALLTPKKPSSPSRPASPLKNQLRTLDNSDSEAEAEDPPPPASRRRYRPVYQDQIQWSQRDPRISRLW